MQDTPEWSSRLSGQLSADADRITLKKLGAAMKQQQRQGLNPGESVEFLPSVERGDGVAALLDHRFGSAGDAQTQGRLSATDDVTLHYQQLLAKAATELGLSEEALQQLHARVNSPPERKVG